METIAEMLGSPVLKTGDHIASSGIDGVHLDVDAPEKLGQVRAQKVKKLLDEHLRYQGFFRFAYLNVAK